MLKLPRSHRDRQEGQALLLILLVMSLVLTLVLSSVSRSVTDVDISKYEDNSIRAFDAAQAGIEKVVIDTVPLLTPVPLSNGASFTPNKTTNTNAGNYFKYPLELSSGESAIIFFVTHQVNADGDYIITCGSGSCVSPSQLRVCWGKPGTSGSDAGTPALYMEYYYNSDTANPTKWQNMSDLSDIKSFVLSADPNATRRLTNKFSPLIAGSGTSCNDLFAFESLYNDDDIGYNDTFPNGALLFLKITMLYNSMPQPVGISSTDVLPAQGSMISSTGQSGDVFRKLVLYQGYPELPSEFGHVIYSKQNLTKP